MGVITFRLDDSGLKKLDAIFAFYGFTSQTATDNFVAMINMVHDLTMNRINSQIVADKLSEHQNKPIDTTCNMRIKVLQLVRVLAKGAVKPTYAMQDIFYCVQWEKGKVKRQLKLVTPLVCEICSILREKWLETPIIMPAPEPAPIRQPLMVTVPNSRPEPVKPQVPPNSFQCEQSRCNVHYTVCLGSCKVKQHFDYIACLKANPEIAQALDYWKNKFSGKQF